MSDYLLIIEDNEDIRETLALVLRARGYEVRTATDGSEGLSCLRATEGGRCALIILDLMIPGVSGFDFRAEQAKDPALASTPVLVVTGLGNAKVTAAQLGVAGGINKPFLVEDLEAMIEKLVGDPRCRP